ncbi:hypothetical protein, partial [Francisella orientalis]|uniref:hypothetical protein n=1 Tax=Francisella orientalis TaxID=299583 RepID=UPI001F3529CE
FLVKQIQILKQIFNSISSHNQTQQTIKQNKQYPHHTQLMIFFICKREIFSLSFSCNDTLLVYYYFLKGIYFIANLCIVFFDQLTWRPINE